MSQTSKNTKTTTGIQRAVPLFLAVGAFFLVICFITENTGFIGRWISRFLLGLFSNTAYGIPFLLAIHAVFYASDCKKNRRLSRFIFSLLALISVSAVMYAIGSFGTEMTFDMGRFYRLGKEGIGGGLVGSTVAYGLIQIVGVWGFFLLAFLVVALYITYFFPGKLSVIKKWCSTVLLFFCRLAKFVRQSVRNCFAKKEKKPDKREAKASAQRQEKLLDDDFFAVDNGLSKLSIPELGIEETRSKATVEQKPTLQNKVYPGNAQAKEPLKTVRQDSETVKHGTVLEPIFYDKSETDKATVEKTSSVKSDRPAEEVFNATFDPFDIAYNQARSQKQSSYTNAAKTTPLREFSEPVEKVRPQPSEPQSTFTPIHRSETNVGQPMREYVSPTVGQDHTDRDDSTALKVERQPIFTEPCRNISSGNAPSPATDDCVLSTQPAVSQPGTSSTTQVWDEPCAPEENTEFPTENPEREPESDPEPIPKEKQNPDIETYRSHFNFLRNDAGDQKQQEVPSPVTAEYDERNQPEMFLEDEEDEPPFETDVPFSGNVRPATGTPASSYGVKNPESTSEKTPIDYTDFVLPPLDLLNRGQTVYDPELAAEIEDKKTRLIDTIASFGYEASISGIESGPRITRYEVVPARGVKVASITNLLSNIELNLASEIRMEAPIPGKSAIGFEIPNRRQQTVYLRDLIESPEFCGFSDKTAVCIGKDISGTPVFGSIAKMTHLLVAGATGMGKSVAINAMLISMLYHAKPDELKLIMIDPKTVEFKGYDGIPHLLVPVVTDSKQAAGALVWVVDEMERRYQLLSECNVRNIDGYNQAIKNDPSRGAPLPRIIVVIDELSDLMLQVRNPVEGLILSIAQKARAAGIHLIIGTQRPSVNVITGTIKANIPSRMSCKVSSNVDSRTILEVGGAEHLQNNGDMLYLANGASKPIRVQGAFVSDGEVERVMQYLRSQSKGNTYDEEVMESIRRAAQKCGKKGDMDGDSESGDNESPNGIRLDDPNFLKAVDIAFRSNHIATSALQRALGIGYSKAARYIDAMEAQGIVSSSNGSKARDVIMKRDEWNEVLARRGYDD